MTKVKTSTAAATSTSWRVFVPFDVLWEDIICRVASQHFAGKEE
jgi:hypothetical protein